MKLGGILGTLVGGGLGFLAGGPVGAIAGSSMLGSIGGSFDQQEAQGEANAANAQAAAEQMRFQERMSSTAHQRQVADLKAAGLNPMLSVNSGSPGAAGASAQSKSVMEGNSFNAVQAAQTMLSLKKLNSEIAVLNSQAAKNTMEAKVASKGIPEADIKNSLFDLFRPLIEGMKSGAKPKFEWEFNKQSGPKKNEWDSTWDADKNQSKPPKQRLQIPRT